MHWKVKMSAYKQDLPPKGGFGAIDWAARGPKRLFGGFTQIALFVGFTTVAWIFYAIDKRKRRALELEMRDSRIAIEPFLLAERDRAILTHYRRNRDEENELMKNVPGWTTGTLWGEPVYNNVRGHYIKPSLDELLAHMSPKEKRQLKNEKLFR